MTKAERKAELIEISRRPIGSSRLRSIACEATGKNPDAWTDQEIGSMNSDYIRTILDAEYPSDNSIPSGPQ